MSVNVSEGVAMMTPEERKREMPYLVSWLAAGAVVHYPYREQKDVVALELDGDFREMNLKDWEEVEKIYEKVLCAGMGTSLSGRDILRCHYLAGKFMEKAEKPLKSMVMLKDRSGAGYWRMVMPANHMEKCFDGTIDVTSAEVTFDSLLEYDTVFVQRLHDWESYYIIEKLKKAGKKVVYDIDDDIFSLTPDNPAFHVIGRDNQIAARETMKLADVVTTTTDILASRLKQVTDGAVEPVVIPNAMNPEGWLPTELTGSPDEWQRVFWQGSATHEADWEVCIEGLNAVMSERDNVRVVILGCLPQAIQQIVHLPHWQGKVEYMGFSDTETYFQIVKHLKAEVGLAPLVNNTFNQAKSPIKWMENTLIGMPTVASAMQPYSDVIVDGVNGRLVSDDPVEWQKAIEMYLDSSEARITAIGESRKVVAERFDVRKTAQKWKSILV